ncbi:MAG TPA: tetratricopeptide repeat protein, partial [Rhodospirillales bacterium]|nr:tetratricopeptide repeat protein [Rhodospirillales bacterium]
PILFKPWATEYIPRPVKGASHYFVDVGGGYEALYRRLVAQPKTPPPPVSPQLRQWRRDPDQAVQFEQVRGLGNVVVQVAGDGRTVVGGQPHLTLARWHGRRRPVRSDLDLLNPFSRAIPLIGREAEMAGLQAWLAGPAPIAARCIVGRAGSGKTRLAIELCEWAEAREWHAGFVDPGELVRFHRQQNLSDWGWQRPTLAVIDGAAAAARVLRQWLVELAYNPGAAGRPFRLLLLERHADRKLGWWSDLVTPRSFQEDGLVDLFDPPEPCLLPSIADEADSRRLVTAGIAAVTARRGGSANAVAHVLPSDSAAWGSESRAGVSAGIEPLYLLMRAISTIADTSPAATGRVRLAQHLARFELGRIEMLAEDRQLKGDFLCHMAGFVTLAGGVALDRLADVIAGEQAALHWRGAGDPPELAEALRDALTEIDGDRGRIVPAVLPELIGEAVVLAALEKQPPEAQTAIVRRAWAAGGRSCVATVVRTAQDFADGKTHASLVWLDALSEGAEKPAELMAISDQLPERTTCMIERASEIDRRLVDAHRELAASDGRAETRLTLAHCLTRLASRLRDVCRFEDALAAAAEAVAVHQALRRSGSPPSSAVGLAEALLRLGGAACDLGRREEALAASAEAVDLLNGETHPAERRSRAHALSIMACHLSDLGRRDEALAAALESVRLHRALSAAQPDTEMPPLALALLNFAHCLSDVGRDAEALAAAEESVGTLAGFARTKPDAFLPGYAQALNSAAVYLARSGRLADALDRSREAIAIQRSLTEGCPEAYRPDLAMMLNGFANALRQSGDKSAALAGLDEAVALLRALAAERPEAYRLQLAKQLNNQAILLVAAADAARALDVAGEAVALLRDAAAKRPDRHDEDLASALVCLGFCQREAGNPRDMLDSALQAVAIRRRLARRWPEAFRPRLARSLLVLGEALKLCGRDAEGETTAAEAAAILAS